MVIFQLAGALDLGFIARLALRHAMLTAACVLWIMLLRFRTAHIALMALRLAPAFFT